MSTLTQSVPEGQSPAVRPSAILTGAGRADPSDVVARAADFAALSPRAVEKSSSSLDRLMDVTVTVTAELGRITLPISGVLNLNVGSVLELGRTVSEPVDLMVQGMRLARAEVVVVGDRFAVRIKEIMEPKGGK
jgi:flagellar motor switch protein FliN/FliY